MTQAGRAVILLGAGESGSPDEGGVGGKRLLGLTPLDRVILTSAQAGVRDFLLVGETGRGWEAAVERLSRDARVKKLGLRLEFASPANMAEAGGRDDSIRPFWLMSTDVVFDPKVLDSASGAKRGDRESLHLVKPDAGAAPNERSGIGLKTSGPAAFTGLPDKDAAAYAGLSLCAPDVFPRLREALAARGAGRLDADGLKAVFGPEPSSLFDTGDLFCLAVSTKDDVRRARAYLLGTARKATDSYFSRHFNRHISLFLTRQFLRLRVPPNVLSVVCLAIGLGSGWFIGRGGYLASAAGALLFEFASIFDGCDGEVARLTFRTSKLGGFLDMIGDATTYVVFFLSLPLGLYRASHRPAWIVLGGVALLAMGIFYVQLSRFMRKAKLGNNVIGVVKDVEQSAGNPGFTGRLDGVAAKIGFIYRRDFFSTLVCVIILAGGAGVLMALLSVFMSLEAGYLFFYARRRLRPAGQAG